MGSEHYCLRWNNHQSNLLGVFGQLLRDESLVDVTLACAEGHSIRAHKVVLSACSSYFRTLFVDHPGRHPIVILKDVRFAELRTLVEFMYKGEVNVEYCQLSALLKTAESLKVKGLAEMTNLNSAREGGAEGRDGVEAPEVPATSEVAERRLHEEDLRTSPREEDGPSPLRTRVRKRSPRDDGDDSCCGDNESCDEGGTERADTPEVDDLSMRGSSVGPGDLSMNNHVSSCIPPSAAITATCSSAVGGLPSPHSGEPLPGPSCLLPVQQVPLSLKKEVEWDRSLDDKSTTGESSSEYRHPHDPESGEVEGKFSSSCTWVTARSPTPFHFPFPPFGGGLGGCFGPGFADVEGMNRQNCSLLSLLHQQSLLASPLSDDGGSRSSTGSGAFRCGVCLAAFPSVWLLERHSALQHSVRSPEDTDLDEKPFKCEQCGQSYRYRSAYLKHREQNHRARLPADKLFTCDVCGMQFRYLKSFKKHRLNHALEKLHSKSPPQVEGFPRSLKSNGSLERILHEKISVNLPESSTDFRTKIFSSIKGGSALVNGDAFPSPPMPLSGDDGRTSAPPAAVTSPPESGGSDQVSSSNEALGASTQVSKTDEKNFYKYSLDDYYFNSGGAVSTPGSPSPKKVLKLENVSDGEQDETVDSPSFGPSASLINFLRMDSVDRQRDRRFACPFCGKCVRSKENLKLHVRKHTGERPFVCLFCGRAFGGKSDLTRHLRIHTGERPYHCEMCGKCFARADYLSKHLTTHIHNAQR